MSELLTEKQAAQLLKVSPSWLRQRRYSGDGPDFIELGERLIRYDRETVLAWAKSPGHDRTESGSKSEGTSDD